MYQHTDFDKQFIRLRAEQFRDQIERWQAGKLAEEQFRPLRLQNGWYVQRYAPMLRVAVPYGELSSERLRVLARVAREYDRPDPELLAQAQAAQARLGEIPLADGRRIGSRLKYGYGHFTTRTNVQFNWIPLSRAADVMELLATVGLHGIQTSGNCIRNINSDALAGIAVDEIADPRPFTEILRQWSSLHPEFSFLPRKFKVSINGAQEDRAALGWYDVGLQLVRNEAGELGFTVRVGGGMGRTPIIGTVLREFLPWNQLMNYLEAVIRVYNRYGRRDNAWKARIKILVKSEGQAYIDQVEEEFRQIVVVEGGPHTITQDEYDRVAAGFVEPELDLPPADAAAQAATEAMLRAQAQADKDFGRWLHSNVRPHRHPQLRAVVLSFKRPGYAPGDATADQMDAAAQLADQFSAGEMRVTHEQNLLLPWVRHDQLAQVYQAAKALGLAKANIGLLTDMIACPGGDFCALANARSLPIAQAITERYQDLDELWDLGEIDLHISGCINSCGHHHSGHIGILGVDKDGKEWYQVTLGGADGSTLSGPAQPGKIIGPSFSAAEVPGVIEALLDTYRAQRQPLAGGRHETFIATVRRIGIEPFKAAANAARHAAQAHA